MKDLRKFRTSHLTVGGNVITDKTAKVGDVLLSDGTWINSFAYAEHKDELTATPVGICGIPKGVLPDGKGRLVSVDYMDNNNPETGTTWPQGILWQIGSSETLGGETFGVSSKLHGTSDGITFNNVITNYLGLIASNLFPYGSSNSDGELVTSYMNLNYNSYESTQFLIPMLKEEKVLNPDIFKTELVIEGTSSTTSLLDEGTTKVPLSDFDGEAHCDWIITYNNNDLNKVLSKFPAIGACAHYRRGNRKWYLPSLGELLLIFTKGAEVVNSFTLVNNGGLGLFFYNWYWTSNVFKDNGGTLFAFGVDPYVGYVDASSRDGNNSVLAVSAF